MSSASTARLRFVGGAVVCCCCALGAGDLVSLGLFVLVPFELDILSLLLKGFVKEEKTE